MSLKRNVQSPFSRTPVQSDTVPFSRTSVQSDTVRSVGFPNPTAASISISNAKQKNRQRKIIASGDAYIRCVWILALASGRAERGNPNERFLKLISVARPLVALLAKNVHNLPVIIIRYVL
jgi:hypothetical protein